MHFNVNFLISFLCASLHRGLVKMRLVGVPRIQHFLSLLQEPDREEGALP